jgi:uncharacterized protein (DUF1778 family)
MPVRSAQLQIRVTPAQKTALKRLARAAGLDVSSYVLARALPDARAAFDAILGRLRREADRRFALAELNDLLTGLAPAEFPEAVGVADLRGLPPVTQNYVAAMVEQAAGRTRVPPPAWVRDVEPLDDPYFAVPFPRLRPYLLRAAPVAFKRRNLFVDSSVGDRV